MERRKISYFDIFKFATLLLLIVFALSILVPYISSSALWWLDLPGLIFPVLLLFVVIFAVIWLFYNWKISILCLVLLLLGWKSISVSFGFHAKPESFTNVHNQKNFTILSYNVNNLRSLVDDYKDTRPHFLKIITATHPDIICLQEFSTIDMGTTKEQNSLLYFRQQLGMPCYYSNDYRWPNIFKLNYFYGSVIYSRFPFIDTGKIVRRDLDLDIIYADLKIANDTVRVITTHLESFRLFGGHYYGGSHTFVNRSDRALRIAHSTLGRLIHGYWLREKQVNVFNRVIRSSPYPVIVCGDFNTVPNSISYFKIKGNLQDAFLLYGDGFGRTYSKLSPTLRIDYIMADPRLQVNSFKVIYQLVSDHYPVVANIKL